MATGNNDMTEQMDKDIQKEINYDTNELLSDMFDHFAGEEDDYEDIGDLDFIMNMNEEDELLIDDNDDNTTVNDTDASEKTIETNQTNEEKILSQKLSQLSASKKHIENENIPENSSSTNNKRQQIDMTNSSTCKKMKQVDEKLEDLIPNYLLATSKSWMQLIEKQQWIKINKTKNEDDLRQIAILMHKLAVNSLQKDLWMTYIKSGTGRLKQPDVKETFTPAPHVWPVKVKSFILPKRTTTNMNSEEEDNACLGVVDRFMRDLNDKYEQYQQQLIEKKKSFIGYTDVIEKGLQTFIEQQAIQFLQWKCDLKQALVYNEYQDQMFQLKYRQHNPTEYHEKVAVQLHSLKYQLEKAKQHVTLLKQRVSHNKPPDSFDSIDLCLPPSIDVIDDPTIRQHLLNRQQKIIEQTKSDFIAVFIAAAGANMRRCQKVFDYEMAKLWQNYRNAGNNRQQQITKPMIDLIDQRLANVAERFRSTSDGQQEHEDDVNRRSIFNKITTTAFSPTLIIDTPHVLSKEQLQLLHRGPTYVPPCQIHLSSSSESIFDITLAQSVPLRRQISSLFSKTGTFQANSISFEEKIMKTFHQLFSLPLPASIEKRALSEKQIVQSIRKYLKDNNLILRRTADQQNVFYLGDANDFEAKAHDYLAGIDSFELVETIDKKTNEQVQKLDQIVRIINSELKTIQIDQHIKKELLNQLHITRSQIEFPYLYFLPKIIKGNTTTVQPFISCLYGPTNELGHFLEQLLRPLVDAAYGSTAFLSGADFVRQLNTHTKSKHHFHSGTLFATFQILNFYSVLSHDTILDALGRFLTKCLSSNRLSNNLSIIAVQDLTKLFLNNNFFYYNEKIYRFQKGSPSSLRYTKTLGDIFLLEWQLCLLNNPTMKNEFYKRHKETAFFTYNGTRNDLNQILLNINRHNLAIQIDSVVSTNINFFDIHLENRDGSLYTSVYHDPNIQSFVLPYVVGHAQLFYCRYFRLTLIRATRYCCSVYDFDQERLYIEMTFLANGFPLQIIECYLQKFFTEFNSLSLRNALDQNAYDALRRTLFLLIDQQNALLEKNQQLENKKQFFHLYYLYDWGPRRQFNAQFRKLWSHYINEYPTLIKNSSKISLHTKHIHSLNFLLAREKPSSIVVRKQKHVLNCEFDFLV